MGKVKPFKSVKFGNILLEIGIIYNVSQGKKRLNQDSQDLRITRNGFRQYAQFWTQRTESKYALSK